MRRHNRQRSAAAVAGALLTLSALGAAHADSPEESSTETPIKHVILIIGENRTFDQVFGTFRPVHGQRVRNLLSEGIVNADAMAPASP